MMEISDEVFINSMNNISKYFQIMLDNKDKKIADLQLQLDQQKAMWNELEKYIIDSSINYNISQETKDWFARIIVKMQELEQGEKDGNNK